MFQRKILDGSLGFAAGVSSDELAFICSFLHVELFTRETCNSLMFEVFECISYLMSKSKDDNACRIQATLRTGAIYIVT